jgi:hypothetical protein
MKTTLILAASLVVAGCAAPGVSLNTTPRAIAGAGNTYYCWKERLSTDGGNLVCNWEASVADACRSNGINSIAKSSVAHGPDNTRRCENGQWLVMLTTR